MIKTAVLVPTYNREDVLKDTLSNCLETYNKFNFDVYVFDSSTNNKSYDIVKNLQIKYSNLYYIRLCELTHLDCKYLEMIRGLHLKEDYEYIFPCGDANSLTDFALTRIMPYLEQGVDLINMSDSAQIIETTEFNSANDYFNSKNFNIGLWGGAIFNKKTLLNMNDNDWNVAIAKWFKLEYEYLNYVGFWLDRLSTVKNIRIVEPAMSKNPKDVLRRSPYKSNSFWRWNAFDLIAIKYPKVYNNIPEIYTGKEEQIKNLLLDNFYEEYFYYLKRNNSFTIKDYYKYKKILDNYCLKIMNIRIFLIAVLPARRFWYKLIKKIIK